MPAIENLDSLITKLKDLRKDGEQQGKASVTVGFTQNYATYVHENLESHHDVGQAKFLEQPARELNNSGELSNIITTAMKRGVPLEKSLLLAGLRIQREAQKLVPVDTGALKASAFTSLTSEEDQAADEALSRSMAKKSQGKHRYVTKLQKAAAKTRAAVRATMKGSSKYEAGEGI